MSSWGSIRMGDVIKVKHEHEMPCDCLILNILGSKLEHQTCYEVNSLWCHTPALKRSYTGTSSKTGSDPNDAKFIEAISGLIKWEYNNQGFVSGSFKQVDNPAAFDITPANIVHRGSIITQASSVICLALNVGGRSTADSTKEESMKSLLERGAKALIERQLQRGRPFQSLIFRALKTVQVVALVLCLVPFALMLFSNHVLKGTPIHRFDVEFLPADGAAFYGQVQRYMAVVSCFMFSLPYLAQTCMEAVIHFHTYFVVNDANLVPSRLRFKNFGVMKTLGQVNSVVADKAAFVDDSKSYVMALKVAGEYVHGAEDPAAELTAGELANDEASVSSSDSEGMAQLNTLKYLPNAFRASGGRLKTDLEEKLGKSGLAASPAFADLLTVATLIHHASVAQRKERRARRY